MCHLTIAERIISSKRSYQGNQRLLVYASRVRGPKSNAPRYRAHNKSQFLIIYFLRSLFFNKFLFYKPLNCFYLVWLLGKQVAFTHLDCTSAKAKRKGIAISCYLSIPSITCSKLMTPLTSLLLLSKRTHTAFCPAIILWSRKRGQNDKSTPVRHTCAG